MFRYLFPTDPAAYRELMVWMVVLAIVAYGMQYAKDIIAFLLDKLYDAFIRETS
jgi:hypothetical protein